MIEVVGMGYKPMDMTLAGQSLVANAQTVVVRTARSAAAKTLDKLGIAYSTLDDCYQEADDFDGLQSLLVKRIAMLDPCVYCVDGDGLSDLSVKALQAVVPCHITAGVGLGAGAYAAGGITAERLCEICALDLAESKVFVAPDADLAVCELDDKMLAGEVKLKLLDAYGDIDGYLVCGSSVHKMPVSELDRQKGYGADCVYILPRLDYRNKQRFAFEDLVKILFRLRAADGCDWDKVQTHQSIRQCCIEEAYELVEAIDLNDTDKMLEETGDVLLQAVFHASLAEDAGEFSTADMVTAICQKMLFRHPHVFGNVHADSVEEALAAWDAAKAQEKKQVTATQKMQQVAPMPALMKAKKIQKIAAKVGYDFDSVEQASGKIDEELHELLAAQGEDKVLEGGDLLFACVNVLRLLDIEPELALMASTRKFADRFAKVEQYLLSQGIAIKDCPKDRLWQAYDAVKAKENHENR